LHLPPQVGAHLPTGSAQSILQPDVLAKLPPAFVHAIRLALSDTLRDIYFFAGLILVVALVSTVFLKEVPIPTTGKEAAPGVGEPPPVEEPVEAELDGETERVPA
jgi:hypothetical protein